MIKPYLMNAVPDGAHFGTTFPHLFFLQYPDLDPGQCRNLYIPRVFGYRIHGKGPQKRQIEINTSGNSSPNSPEQTVSVSISCSSYFTRTSACSPVDLNASRPCKYLRKHQPMRVTYDLESAALFNRLTSFKTR